MKAAGITLVATKAKMKYSNGLRKQNAVNLEVQLWSDSCRFIPQLNLMIQTDDIFGERLSIMFETCSERDLFVQITCEV